MNVEIGTEAAQFPEKEYINGIFVAMRGTSPVLVDGFTRYVKQDTKSVFFIFLSALIL